MKTTTIYSIININDVNFNELNIDKIENVYCINSDYAHILIESVINNPKFKNKRQALINLFNIITYFDNFLNQKKMVVMSYKVLQRLSSTDFYRIFKKMLFEFNVYKTIPTANGYTYNFDEKKGALQATTIEWHNDYKYNTSNTALVIIYNNSITSKKTVTKDIKYPKNFTYSIKHTTINITDAINAELVHHTQYNTSLVKLSYRINAILNLYFYSERKISTSVKCNRVTHSLSNISRVSRKYLTCKGEHYLNIDLANSQPLLLNLFFAINRYDVDYNYKFDTQTNQFYSNFYAIVKSHLLDDTLDTTELKKIVKQSLYKTIFFNFKSECPNNFTKIEKAIHAKFKTAYPKIFFTLTQLYKIENYNLAIELQKIESDIFNNITINDSKAYFTLYDSIYYTSSKDTTSITQQIQSYFEKHNLTCTLHYNE